MDRRLLVLALGMFAVGTDNFVVAGLLPEVADSLHVSIGLAGQMVTVFALSFAILSPVVATLAASWPRKRLLLGGLAIFTVANAATALSTSLAVVIASRLFAGLGAAMFTPTANATAAAMVPPEQRGKALAIVIGGLTVATALGSPLGTAIGSLGGWRLTLWLVAGVAALAGLGVWRLLSGVPTPPPIGLRQRLAPLADSRVALTLTTSFAAYGGMFMIYTYFGVVFDRVTGGDGTKLAALLLLWGIAATLGNIATGRLTDRLGGRRLIVATIGIAAIDLALLPWIGGYPVPAMIAIFVWGFCGWGLMVPQQHRLIGIAPAMAPLLMGLSTMSVFFGGALSGVIGALGIDLVGGHQLSLISAAFLAVALIAAEAANRRIHRHERATAADTAPGMMGAATVEP